MSFFINKKNIKIISSLLLIMILFSFANPVIIYADADSKTGGKLFKPVFKLLAAVGDLFIKMLQYLFTGDGDIRIENPRKISK